MVSPESILLGLLALVRITAAVFTAPVLGNPAVPIRFRFLVSLSLGILTYPLLMTSQSLVMDDWLQVLFSELAIGITLGLGVSIIFAAAQMVGTVISQMASLPALEAVPSIATPVGKLFAVLSIAVFVLMNGPELVVSSILDTFVHVPIGTSLELDRLSDLAITLLRQSFLLTLRGAAPAVAAIMVSTIVVGVISRNFPQLNLMGMGFTSNLVIMMLALFFTLGGCIWLFVDDLEYVQQTIREALANASNAVSNDALNPSTGQMHVR